jgi:hypothetical protein
MRPGNLYIDRDLTIGEVVEVHDAIGKCFCKTILSVQFTLEGRRGIHHLYLSTLMKYFRLVRG